MTNILTKTLRSSFLILAFSLFINTASAQNCATPPTCEQLGYNLSEVKCRGVASLKCPFDTSKHYCSATMMLGDILYSDKSFSSNLIASKTPIGIIFDVENRLAVAFDHPSKKHVEGGEVPDTITGITKNDGKVNTRIILNYTKEYNEKGPGEIHYPAVEYASTYFTAGTKAGDWFLASAIESGLLALTNTTVVNGFANANKDTTNLSQYLLQSTTSTIKGQEYTKIIANIEIPSGINPTYPTFPVIKF